ncbi:MAG: DNA glycosylase [Dehalococcoidia bacterium]
MSNHSFILPLTQPLDLPSTLASGQCFRWRQDAAGAWVGVLGCDIVRLSVMPEGLTIQSTPTPPAELAEYIAAYLRLDDDLPAIQARLGVDAHVAEGIAHYPGLRLLRQDPWETLAGFILSSTSNIPRISRTMELIAANYGEPVSLDNATRYTFPPAAVLADAGEEALRGLGCGFRAPYLAQAAAAVAFGGLPLHGLRGAPYADAMAALTSLHGVGEKVADCVMLFSLDLLEAFPADRWVRRVVEEWYGLPPDLRYDGVRQWAWARFGGDAGYANQFLFWDRRQRKALG